MNEYIYEHKPSGADHMGKPVELPTLVQREEIVRCRDCEWFLPDNKYDDSCRWFCRAIKNKNGFCAWGERKEGGE